MGKYVIGRLGQAVLVLAGISLLTFALVHLVPGNPARVVLGPRAPASAVAQLDHQLGLDRALPIQYATFVVDAVQGNFGTSITQHLPVASVIGSRIPPSLLLAAYSLAVSILVAVPLGALAAVRRNRSADHAIRLFSTLTFAMPPFWLGLLLVLLFSVKLGAFPTAGYGTSFAGHLRSLTLPAIAVGLYMAPLVLRLLRSSMITTSKAEFVEAARARGLKSRRVLLRHVFRNSIIAPLTVVGILAGGLITATVTVENVFALPGLGTLLVQSVSARDFPTVEALALLFGTVVVLANLVTDLLYVVVDPRVRL